MARTLAVIFIILQAHLILSLQDFERCNVGYYRASNLLSDFEYNCPKSKEVFRFKWYSAYPIYMKIEGEGGSKVTIGKKLSSLLFQYI